MSLYIIIQFNRLLGTVNNYRNYLLTYLTGTWRHVAKATSHVLDKNSYRLAKSTRLVSISA